MNNYQKSYYQKNKERCKLYYQLHKEKHKEYYRNYYIINKEKVNEYSKNYYEKYKDLINYNKKIKNNKMNYENLNINNFIIDKIKILDEQIPKTIFSKQLKNIILTFD